MASGNKRIQKEFGEVSQNPPTGIKVSLIDDDIHNWSVLLDGPEGSPYAGGKFKLHLNLPTEYPFKPPTVTFKTRIWHPNVTFDDKGSICIGILKTDAWKPSSKIMSVLTAVQQLLVEPVPDDAVEASAGEKFKNNRKEFDKEAKEYTKKYAK